MICSNHLKPFGFLFVFMGFAAAVQSAAAQTRFSLSEIDNGYLLLDQKTGVISICTRSPAKPDSELNCATAPNDRKELEARLSTLEAELATLREKLAAINAQDRRAQAVEKPASQEKNVQYYWRALFSEELREKISGFFTQSTKRLFEMVDAMKSAYKESV